MTKGCAVIAEYDPFHNGHLHHLAETVKKTGAPFTAVFLSSYISQRGTFTLFSPHDRARMALLGGADLVFGLPCRMTCREAEWYANAAVSAIDQSGCFDHLSFGCEMTDNALLTKIASLMENPTDDFSGYIRKAMQEQKWSYPKALGAAIEKHIGIPADALKQPNTILAVSYLRALIRRHSSIQPVIIPRSGAYHAREILPEAPSASAIRSAWQQGRFHAAEDAVPASSLSVMREAMQEKACFDSGKGDAILFSKLSLAGIKDLSPYCPAGEGLEQRICQALPECRTREELLEKTATSRITKARVSRILTSYLLGISGSEKNGQPFVRLLGFRRTHSALIRRIAQNLPCYDSFKQMEMNPSCASECNAARLWRIGSGLPLRGLYEERPIIL